MPPAIRVGPAALGVALVLVLSACGSGGSSDDGPSKVATACRGEWKDLGKQVRGNDEKTNPSALAQRWNSVIATIDYYVTSAKASGCKDAIDEQKQAITALTEFGEKLAPYDMELRLEQVRDDAEAYAAGPRPTPSPSATPSPSKKDTKKPSKKAKKPKAPPLPPTPSSIADAVKTLTTQAPRATEQQAPGWEQAQGVELTDDAAVTKAVRDLAVLSTVSPAWRACKAALARIRLALAAKG